MLAVTLAAVTLLPLILVVAGALDLACGRRRLPSARVALFLVQYAINDSVEIVLAPVYWAIAGFGRRLGDAASVRRHERLQAWSIALLARRAEQLLGVRLDVDAAAPAALLPAPAIVLCRHVNLIDASLPSLLYQRLGVRSRGVIMAELLADPGFDLIYARTGSVFVARDQGPEARDAIRPLADGLGDDTVVVIFPEGRLFRRDRLSRSMERMATSNPARAARLGALHNVLPPRPGGTLALLDAVPAADVVVITHAGLDRFASFRDLARAVPLAEPIKVGAWRIARGDIPTGVDGQLAWLDEQWLAVDRWVDTHS